MGSEGTAIIKLKLYVPNLHACKGLQDVNSISWPCSKHSTGPRKSLCVHLYAAHILTTNCIQCLLISLATVVSVNSVHSVWGYLLTAPNITSAVFTLQATMQQHDQLHHHRVAVEALLKHLLMQLHRHRLVYVCYMQQNTSNERHLRFLFGQKYIFAFEQCLSLMLTLHFTTSLHSLVHCNAQKVSKA